MSEADQKGTETESKEKEAGKAHSHAHSHNSGDPKEKRILLVPYPKFVFMYPTLIVTIVATIVLWLGGHREVGPEDQVPVVITGLYLAVMMANLFVIVFDFPRATSLTLMFIVTTGAMGIWLLFLAKPDLLPSVGERLKDIRPVANTTFYFCMSVAMSLMYVAVFVSTRFNYWELRNNELLHHHGLLSDLKRYPAPNLRVDKEINDVFEFLLLGSGRLILHPSTEKRAIVLDNILFVGSKEEQMTRMLGSIKVKIGNDSGH